MNLFEVAAHLLADIVIGLTIFWIIRPREQEEI